MAIDLDKFSGRLPYASDVFGVFQPLLGWSSKLTHRWFERRRFVLPDFPRHLRYRDHPEALFGGNGFQRYFRDEFPRAPLSGQDPALASFERSPLLDSVLVRLLQEAFRDEAVLHPVSDQAFWADFISSKLDEVTLQAFYRQALMWVEQTVSGAQGDEPVPPEVLTYLQSMMLFFPMLRSERTAERWTALQDFTLLVANREYFVARYLHELVVSNPAAAASEVFRVRKLPSAIDALKGTDLFALAPHSGRDAVLSPVGIIHLFRQTFFEFESFLGEPVEHVWLSPGATVELVETSSRRVLTERTFEQTFEEVLKREVTDESQDDLSTAVKSENQRDTKLGSQFDVGINILIVKAEGGGSLEIKETEKTAREEAHKLRRQQTTKLASEIRQSFKSTFKTVVETTDSRSKRYAIQNPGPTLVNYELRRKMRQVGVQMQYTGTQLAWQIFADEPGQDLGLGELVHIASRADLSRFPELPTRVVPKAYVRNFTVFVPVPAPGQSSNTTIVVGAAAVGFGVGGPAGAAVAAGAAAILDELFGEEQAGSDYAPNAPHNIVQRFKVEIPDGYELAPMPEPLPANLQGAELLDGLTTAGAVRFRWQGPNGADVASHTAAGILNPQGEFFVQINGGKVTPGELIAYDLAVLLKPTQAALDSVESANKGIIEQNKLNAGERANAIQAEFIKNVKERVTLASKVRLRPAVDLREEERTIVFRRLIARLMREAWKISDDANDRSIAHLRSELLRSIFDLDRMLYFVAPEWWLPRVHSHQQLDPGMQRDPFRMTSAARNGRAELNITKAKATLVAVADGTGPPTIGQGSTAAWGGAGRPDNYLITDESEPARLGASLGWLLQLDGDNLRNAFLNAPWVKAVVPIRPGKEREALEWLMQSDIEGKEGLQAVISDGGAHDGETVEQMLMALADDVKARHTASRDVRTETFHDPITDQDVTVNYLANERVFERGFDRLMGGFRAIPDEGRPDAPFETIDQWVEILPTDQLVAVPVEYDAKTGRLK